MQDETNYQISSDDFLQREMLKSSEEQRFEQLKADFANEYDISSKAGQSGQGDVFFARHKSTLKWYVLKKPKTEETDFEQEARFVLSLGKHPNLIYTYSLIEKNDTKFLVMEYIGPRPHFVEENVQGDTLAAELQDYPHGFPTQQALLWAIDLCRGMEYLYSQKGFQGHNDLKPDNLFITQEGVLKIGDFGLVNRRGGTVGYRPQEWKREQGQQRDIYSFGIVFYEMLNGPKNPHNPTIYGGESISKEMTEQQYLDWGAIDKSNYSTILRKCLAPQVQDRYASFADLRHGLEQAFIALKGDLRPRTYEVQPLTAYECAEKGRGWAVLHEEEQAVTCYTHAIELDPNDAKTYYNRGNAL